MKHLFTFTEWRHWSTLSAAVAAACACAAVRTTYAVALGQVFQIITDYGTENSDAETTLARTSKWCIIICGLGTGGFVANALLMWAWIVFGELQASNARKRMFDDLLHQEMSWYDRQVDGTPSLLVRVETQVLVHPAALLISGCFFADFPQTDH